MSVSAVLAVAYGWFWAVEAKVMEWPESPMTGTQTFLGAKVPTNDHTSAAGINLGMGIDAVLGLHAGVRMRTVAHGEPVGEFTHEGVLHTLWFAGGGSTSAVYRIRMREYSERLPTDAIHARFAERYGQPAAVECRQGSKVSRQGLCHVKWITREGVAIEVASRNLTDKAGRAGTELTVTFTDILVANKILASRHPGRAGRA